MSLIERLNTTLADIQAALYEAALVEMDEAMGELLAPDSEEDFEAEYDDQVIGQEGRISHSRSKRKGRPTNIDLGYDEAAARPDADDWDEELGPYGDPDMTIREKYRYAFRKDRKGREYKGDIEHSEVGSKG